jgi:hypothetical protein
MTALTGFRAAVFESHRVFGAACPVVIHSGFWGCGAFGGNRELMMAMQVVAATLAPVDRIVFHIGEPSGRAAEVGARALLASPALAEATEPGRLIAKLEELSFPWGVSDGN